jgi:hypothetical protein
MRIFSGWKRRAKSVRSSEYERYEREHATVDEAPSMRAGRFGGESISREEAERRLGFNDRDERSR